MQWFVRNQHPDGTWLYEYDAARDVVVDDYNFVRHAGAVMGLYQAATVGIPDALESADRGSAWVQDRLVEHDGWTALAFDGRAPVGATALLRRRARRASAGHRRHDRRRAAASLGRFLVDQTEPSGAVIAQYDATAMSPVAGSRSKYYTGEAYWALARLHRVFPDDGFGAAADRIGNYLATQRDDVEDLRPPIPDHWAAYGLAETVEFPERDRDRPLTDAELAYARRLAGLFGSQVRWISQQAGPWGSVVRGTKVPRGGGYGVGRRGAGRPVAGRRRRERPARRRPGRDRGAGRVHRRSGHRRPGRRLGRRAAGPRRRGVVHRRRDADGRPAARHVRAAAARSPSSRRRRATGHDEPNRWLWALALHRHAQPGVRRAGRAAPLPAGGAGDAGRRRRGRRRRCSWCSPPRCRGRCSTRSTSARRRPGSPSGSSARWRRIVGLARRPPGPQRCSARAAGAALVPVAVPLVATPALLLLGLGAGADLGTLFVAGCLALGVGAAHPARRLAAGRRRPWRVTVVGGPSGSSARSLPSPASSSWSTPSSRSDGHRPAFFGVPFPLSGSEERQNRHSRVA